MIHSERLVFREINKSDFPIIAQIMRDEETQKVWGHYFSDDDIHSWIDRRLTGYRENGTDYFLAVLKGTDEPVGQIGLLKENINGEQVWGIGYILSGAHRKKGYATEGAKAMIDYAFNTLNLSEVICDIRPTNKKSIAVAKRLGMIQTGSFVKIYNGQEIPHLIFRLKNRNNP